MEAEAIIRWGTDDWENVLRAQLSPLQAAQIAASKYGFFDLDVDADDRVVRIVATAKGRSFTAKGKSLTLAVESLLETLTDG